MSESRALVDHFLRHEFGRLVAVLTRSLGVRRLDLFRLGRHSAGERAWREALRFTTARAEREFLRRRLAVCRGDGGEPTTR
ncbi:MAG: hypothetical protein ACLQIB_11255 [Isosphaeraceae bacterium]